MKAALIALVIVAFGGIMFGLNKKISTSSDSGNNSDKPSVLLREDVDQNLATATFSTGCFWCIEPIFESTEGVSASVSGYAGGEEFNPTYEDVYSEITGHRESVMVVYDPEVVTYAQLLDIFWQNIDPTDAGGQFFDRGLSYTTAVFYSNDDERTTAEASKKALEESGKFDKPIATSLLPFTTFYEAEDYHQNFYLKSPGRYQNYSEASGRKQFKERIWQEIQKDQEKTDRT